MSEAMLFQSFDLLATAPGGVARLRKLILSLAVHGKLVPQDSQEAVAEISRIPDLVLNLIEAGKVPSGRAVSKVDDLSDMQDSLPLGWRAVTANTIFVPRSGNSKLIKGKLHDSNGPHLFPGYSASGQDVWLDSYEYDGMAIILSAVGARCGKAFLATGKWSAIANTHVIWPLEEVVLPTYAMLLLNDEQFWIRSGGAQPFVKVTDTLEKVVWLPPFAEQARIVARVEELMKLCNALEEKGRLADEQHTRLTATLFEALANSESAHALAENWKLVAEHFDLLLDRPEAVDTLEQTILQLAVRGLLVPQDPQDEPASELLKKIRAEKDDLIADGKIKRDKPLPLIADEERPFELPIGWVWARFPELGQFGRGKSKHRPRNDPALFNPPIYPVVQTGEVARANGVILEFHSKYSEVGLAQSRLWPKGTLCITIAANIADAAVLGFDACFPDSVVGFVPASVIGDASYFLAFMETARSQLIAFAPATAQKNINLEILESVLIPIPPLAEMSRIVTRVIALRRLCADLRKSLATSQTVQSMLSESLVAEVV